MNPFSFGFFYLYIFINPVKRKHKEMFDYWRYKMVDAFPLYLLFGHFVLQCTKYRQDRKKECTE